MSLYDDTTSKIAIDERYKEWARLNKKSLKETGIPICPVCLKPMIKCVDSLTGELSDYLFKCKCMPPNMRVAMLRRCE